VTIVRIVFTLNSRPGRMPDGSGVTDRRLSQHLIVLADDAGQRAVPMWLRIVGARELLALVERPARETVMAGVLETAARLLDAAGVRVTAVDIEPASENVSELRSDTVAARVGLATAGEARHVLVSAEYGLALARVAGAPVGVADELMDRLAVPVQAGDVLAPFLPPAGRPPGRPGLRLRFEPRNMAFTDGMDYWEMAGSFPDAGQSPWQDISCAAPERSAVLVSAVPEPSGFAVLVQTIYADDYRGCAVTFRGQLRTTGIAGHAGLHLAAGRPGEPPGVQLRDRGGNSLTSTGSSDWTWHEVTMPVPGDADVIRFGISLTGRGRIELRNAEFTRAQPDALE
jgi:hypothetical protein